MTSATPSGEAPRRGFGTRAIHAGQAPDPSTGAIMPPIYATSTFVQESPGVHKGLDYGRSHNPTRWALERCVADLESGGRGFAFASGLAAIATVLELLDSGAHVVAGDDLYGGTYRLFERVRRKSAGHDFTFVDLSSDDNLLAALRPETKLCGSRRRPIRCSSSSISRELRSTAARAASSPSPTTRSQRPGSSVRSRPASTSSCTRPPST